MRFFMNNYDDHLKKDFSSLPLVDLLEITDFKNGNSSKIGALTWKISSENSKEELF